MKAEVTQEKTSSWTSSPWQEPKKQQEAPQEARPVLPRSWSLTPREGATEEKAVPRTVLSSSRTSVLRKPENIWRGRRKTSAMCYPGFKKIGLDCLRLRPDHLDSDFGYANYNAHDDESGITKTRWLTGTCGQEQEAYLPGSAEPRDKQESSLAPSAVVHVLIKPLEENMYITQRGREQDATAVDRSRKKRPRSHRESPDIPTWAHLQSHTCHLLHVISHSTHTRCSRALWYRALLAHFLQLRLKHQPTVVGMFRQTGQLTVDTQERAWATHRTQVPRLSVRQPRRGIQNLQLADFPGAEPPASPVAASPPMPAAR